MCGHNSGMSSASPKQGKIFYIKYVCKHLVFEVQPGNVLISILEIFICEGHLKTLVFADPIESEQTFHQRILMHW
jgi:hypothetical protein